MKDHRGGFNYLFYMLSIFVATSILFLFAFFPTSKNIRIDGQEHYKSFQPHKLDEYLLQPPLAKFDQIILIIIDAWRLNFVNYTNMPYAFKQACECLQIKVDIPTVTMPRIKSMTTGTISNFIDIVLNLGHTSQLDDSILHRLVEKNKTTIFAGDRTWIQLFPKEFLRTFVNTDSFYVNDFYEGDKNVTMTLKNELKLSDWHFMILHYLGLDHIGHVEGSDNDKIHAKLLEMDNIIKYISTSERFKRNMLLVTGDHGMRNGGSHGGSDKEEIYVPLMAFFEDCVNRRQFAEYNQIDISATLAVLFSVDIPQTSIGCLIPEMLNIYSKEEQLYFFYYNTLHLIEKLKGRFNLADIKSKDYYSWYIDATISHKEFISSQPRSLLSYENAKQNYIRLSKIISEILSESLIRHDISLVIVALSLTTLSALKLIISILFEITPNFLDFWIVWKITFFCFMAAGCINFLGHYYSIFNTSNLIHSVLLTVPIALSIYFTIDVLQLLFTYIMSPLLHNRKVKLRLKIPSVLLLLFLTHSASLASSSFVEEEHQTWYYFTPSILLLLVFQNFYNNIKSVWQKQNLIQIVRNEFWSMWFTVIVMLSIIVCRRLNQTGDKWRHLIDIGDILARNENHVYLSLTLLSALVLLWLQLRKHHSNVENLFSFVALLCIYLYRQVEPHSFLIVMLFWISLIGVAFTHYSHIIGIRKKYEYNIGGNLVELLKINLTCCLLITALLHKPHNVILLPALIYTLEKTFYFCDSLYIKDKTVYDRSYVLALKTVMTIFIANMFYFFQGNSNSLTTIDLNSGYIGLSSYKPLIVGLLITLNTYCASINSFLFLMWHMFASQIKLLPLRQEKEKISNIQLFESTEEDLVFVYSLFTATTIMPVAVYWCYLVGFRNHLFIYSVFAPKAFYELFHLSIFYINFIITNLYFRLYLK